MALLYNGNQVKAVYYNGNQPVKKVVYNNVTVWESSKTYRFGAQGALNPALDQYGNVSGYNGSNPTAAEGSIAVGEHGIVWYFNRNAADKNGSTETLYSCMQKSITSMKFVAYRSNTLAGNASSAGRTWVYGSYTTGSNTYYVSVPATSGLNLVYRGNGSTISRDLPQPSAAGMIDQNLTTNELKDIFKNEYCRQYTGSTISIGVNNYPTYTGYTNLPNGQYFYGLGYRYTSKTQNPSFLFRNPAYFTDAYVEIVAS